MKRYVLLLRHGAVDHASNLPDRMQPLENRGEDIRLIANVFAEHLNLLPEDENILIGEIWSGSYTHTNQAADIIYNTLRKEVNGFRLQEFRECRALDPDNFRLSRDQRERQKVGKWLVNNEKDDTNFGENKLRNDLKKEDDKLHTSNAILVVGHAPQISWIAERILGRPFPIARAELACIGISDSWWDRLLKRDKWVLWTIWDSNPELTKELYAKIDSKMKLAGILGGVSPHLNVVKLPIVERVAARQSKVYRVV